MLKSVVQGQEGTGKFVTFEKHRMLKYKDRGLNKTVEGTSY